MQYIRSFAGLKKSDVHIAGGKGASLGEMTKAGIPVPSGFVVLAQTFDRFVGEAKLEPVIVNALGKVKPKHTPTIDNASKVIRKAIQQAKMPMDIVKEIQKTLGGVKAKHFAVRSSATAEDASDASWAGELESYLNVHPKGVVAAVQKCWSSLFTPRAIFYRFEKKLHKIHVSVAVVVQAMIQSEVSGIAFTAHPVTKNRKHLVIEAGYGLGEAIVGGKITPDMFVVRKKNCAIIERSISDQRMQLVRKGSGTKEMKVPREKVGKQKISDAVVLRLAKLCLRIEQHYKKPQDIEWTFVKGKISIVQSRPITTL